MAQTQIASQRWLVSYADLVTLLLVLFVVLFVVARNSKSTELNASLTAAESEIENKTPSSHEGRVPLDGGRGILPGSSRLRGSLPTESANADALARRELLGLQTAIAEFAFVQGIEHAVRTRIEPRGLIISLSEGGFFDSAVAEAREEAVPKIDALADLLIRSDHHIRIEGHTDGRPIRTARFPSNWELSTARASWLVSHLVTEFGMNPERLSAAGYGQFRPVATNQTAEGRAMNRRVDLVLLSKSGSEQSEPLVSHTLTR